MADASVISQMNGTPRELNQGGTSTTETVFTTDGTVAVVLPLPSAAELAGTNRASMFVVRAWGTVSTAASLTYAARLYYGTSTTIASNTIVLDSGTVTIATTTTNWMIEGTLCWDGNGDILTGWGTTQVHGTTSGGQVAIRNGVGNITSVDPDGNGTLGFVVSGTFGTGNAGNTARLLGFQIVK